MRTGHFDREVADDGVGGFVGLFLLLGEFCSLFGADPKGIHRR